MADRAVRILVVDDDEDTRDLITFALQAHHYGVTPVASGEGALEAMRQASFDLVITDYDMPGLTGAEMLKQASGQGLMKSSAALVITAHRGRHRTAWTKCLASSTGPSSATRCETSSSTRHPPSATASFSPPSW